MKEKDSQKDTEVQRGKKHFIKNIVSSCLSGKKQGRKWT